MRWVEIFRVGLVLRSRYGRPTRMGLVSGSPRKPWRHLRVALEAAPDPEADEAALDEALASFEADRVLR